MPDCKQYEGITRKELADLRKTLADQGVTVPPGDDVEFAAPYGIEMRVTYNESQQTMDVCITKKPFFVPESQVWKIVDSGIGAQKDS